LSIVAALIVAVATGPVAAQAADEDRVASLTDVAGAAELCLDTAGQPTKQKVLFEQAGWRALPRTKTVINGRAVTVDLGAYLHPTNNAVLAPGLGGQGGCAVTGNLATRISDDALDVLMERQLGGRLVGRVGPRRSIWTVRGHPVRAWSSRDAQSPAVSLIVGSFTMEKK
jgi:hypothetical protein